MRKVLKYFVFSSIFFTIFSIIIGVTRKLEPITNSYELVYFILFRGFPVMVFSVSITMIIFDKVRKIWREGIL